MEGKKTHVKVMEIRENSGSVSIPSVLPCCLLQREHANCNGRI